MTFRLCLVGNSHLGAYKRAWNKLQHEFDNVSISMYGAPGLAFGDLQIEGSRIVATSKVAAASFRRTGGEDHVRVEAHDALVVVGGGRRLNVLASMLRHFRPPFLNPDLAPGRRSAADSAEGAKRLRRKLAQFYGERIPVLASTSMLETTLVDSYRQSKALQLLHGLTGRTRLGHVATPFPASSILELKPQQSVSRIVAVGAGEAFSALKWQSLRRALPRDVALVRPPDDVIVQGILTDKVYSTGSIALDDERGAHGDDDISHMNDAYGEIMLRRVIAQFCA